MPSCERAVYCITPALDRYLLHLDGTPCTWTMMSLNICGMVLYNTWHPHSHTSLFSPICPNCLHPSNLLTSQPHIISSFPQSLADILVSIVPDLICSPYHC